MGRVSGCNYGGAEEGLSVCLSMVRREPSRNFSGLLAGSPLEQSVNALAPHGFESRTTYASVRAGSRGQSQIRKRAVDIAMAEKGLPSEAGRAVGAPQGAVLRRRPRGGVSAVPLVTRDGGWGGLRPTRSAYAPAASR